MTKLIAKLKTNPKAYKLQVHGKLELPYAERQLRGEVLRNGEHAGDKHQRKADKKRCTANHDGRI